MDLTLQVGSLVGIFYHLTMGTQLNHNSRGADITAFFDSLVGRQERFVLYQLEPAGMVHQRITGNTCFRVISLGKAAVDDQQFPVRLNRILSLDGTYRHMTIDDVAMYTRHSELIQQPVTYLLFFT